MAARPPRPPPNPSTSTSTSTSSTSVRRNLFHHHLSRRPTSTTSSAMADPASFPNATYPKPSQPFEDDSSAIVVKVNGKYEVTVPELPPREKGEEDGAGGEGLDEIEAERERLEKQLLEMYRNRSLQPGDPGDLLVAVHASLRRKVQGLDADNWMFEEEGAVGEG